MTLLTLLLAAPGYACPTIVTGQPSELSFDTAQVAIVRQGNRTTFSVSINPVGEQQEEFALVMPVPTVLQEDEIKTLDAAIFGRLDGYTAPRHVWDAGCSYPYDYDDASSSADTGSAPSGGGGGGVDVEAEYLIGEYEIVILSADQSGDLFTWLNENGYYMAAGAEDRLQEYIDAGSYFMAAKVSGDAAAASGESLSPLQISYESDIFAIPIRLATINSPGEQDMVIYAITDLEGATDGGRVGLANYPEFDVPDKCIWGDASEEDFNEFYQQRFTEAWEAMSDGAWTVEYAGTWNDCSPCSSVSMTEWDLKQLGFKTGRPEKIEHHLTRLRMRYTPEQAIEDLVLYGSGIYEPEVTSFADSDNWLNAECIEFCDPDDAPDDSDGGTGDGGGADTGPGGGDDGTTGGDDGTSGGDDGTGGGDDGTTGGDGGGDGAVDTDAASGGDSSDNKSGCSTSGGPVDGGVFIALLGLVGFVSRRKTAR